MANTLGLYDPLFYAQEALMALEKALGMAGVVHRGYEPTPTQKGSTIKINRPSTFVAADMPVVATDLAPSEVEIKVDQWKGVTFALTDKELSHTKEKIIEDHIRPAAYAVADAIDLSLVGLYKDIPNIVNANTGTVSDDFPDIINSMFGRKVPKDNRWMMIDGNREAAYLKSQLFVQANTSSDGAQTQREGFLGKKFGFDIFSNQNTPTHVPGALASVTQLQANAAYGVGVTTIVLKDSDAALTGTVKKGDVFTITSAGGTQSIVAKNDATAAANLVSIDIADPRGLRIAVAQNDNVAAVQTAKVENIAAHRNAFALGMAPLSELGGQLGARIATIGDPITGLALRSRMWYDGDNAKVKVGIDALWGVKTLDADLAVRLRA